MAEPSPSREKTPPALIAREQALAKALRANLKRRKAAAKPKPRET